MNIFVLKFFFFGYDMSYNLFLEYLFIVEEKVVWESVDFEEREKEYFFVKFDVLCKVLGYGEFVKEWFE